MIDRKIFAWVLITFVLLCLIVRKSVAQTWEANPFSFNNSELTLQNNSMDWNNSPLNWNNTYLNPYAKNGVYDNAGNRIGYERKNEYGTTNIFDNEGNRQGYKPR
jgi:hypothetical protein